MNLYIASVDSQDAQLAADRLMDQDVTGLSDEKEPNVFSLYVSGCQVDTHSGTWKSSKATPQLMEKMDYEDNTDNTDGYYDNTAKKCRLSSYESSTASLQSVQSSSSSIDHSTSQIYTGNFGRMMSEERKCISLNIFMLPWDTNVSSVVHRLFLTTTGILLFVINTEACRLQDYREKFLKMLDSLWAFSKGEDIRFPKVLVAATTLAKNVRGNIAADIASLLKSWIQGKLYEYQCQENLDHVFLLSNYLKYDETKSLKDLIFGVLKKTQTQPDECDSLTEKLDALRKSNTKIVARNHVGIRHMSSTEVEKRLLEMHDRKEILYLHQMIPKWIVLDPEFLIRSLIKILERTNGDTEIAFFKEMDLKNIFGSKHDAPLIDIMCHVGILAKAVHNHKSNNVFVVSACPKVPNDIKNLKHLPQPKDCPYAHSPILCLKFKELPMVSCAFQMLVCLLLNHYPYDLQGRQCLIYENVAAFKVSTGTKEKQRLIICTEGMLLFIYIIRYSDSTETIDATLCGKIRKLVEVMLTELLDADLDTELMNGLGDRANDREKKGTRRIDFEYMIRCPETNDLKINEEGLINVNDLKPVADKENNEKSKIYYCDNHSDKAHPHGVDVEPLLCSWFPEITLSNNQGCMTNQTETSSSIPSSPFFGLGNYTSKIVTEKIAGQIAACIGQRWEFLAYELDLDQPTLDKIRYNNPRDVDKAITDVLMHCVNKRQGKLTLKEVDDAIRKHDVNVNWEKFKNLYHT